MLTYLFQSNRLVWMRNSHLINFPTTKCVFANLRSEEAEPLGMVRMGGVLMVWAAGLVLTCLIFLAEVFHSSLGQRKLFCQLQSRWLCWLRSRATRVFSSLKFSTLFPEVFQTLWSFKFLTALNKDLTANITANLAVYCDSSYIQWPLGNCCFLHWVINCMYYLIVLQEAQFQGVPAGIVLLSFTCRMTITTLPLVK